MTTNTPNPPQSQIGQQLDNGSITSLYDMINQLEIKFNTQQNIIKQLESQLRQHDNQIKCNSSNIEVVYKKTTKML